MVMVIDASVAVKWFNTRGEDNVEIALKIQAEKTENIIEIIVPSLFFMEIVNAFLTKSFFGLQDIILIEESLNKMNLTVTAIDHLVLKNSIDIAYENSLTLYDSIYIETARANNAVLLTEDKKILSAGKRYGFIRSLAEYKS